MNAMRTVLETFTPLTLILLILFVLLGTDARAQNQTWARAIGGPFRDGASSLVKTRDGGFIVAGRFNDGQRTFSLIAKFDAAGEIVWQKKFRPIGAEVLRASTDGHYFVAGKNWIAKFTEEGKFAWFFAYPGGLIRDVRASSRGGAMPLDEFAGMDQVIFGFLNSMQRGESIGKKPLARVVMTLEVASCEHRMADIWRREKQEQAMASAIFY